MLNIDKPSDWTSHDVVAHIRRLTRVPRVGHAGTLDPQATGVLLIGLGTGTKLTQFLHECPKTYRATLQLGVRTDTCDAAGKVVEVCPVREMSRGEVEAVLAGFRGAIEQIPPMFSALKQQGRRLYTLARQGIDVDRQPRRVQIFRLALLELTAATLSLEVECSSGTYIRVLGGRHRYPTGLWGAPERTCPHGDWPIYPGASAHAASIGGARCANTIGGAT